MPGRATCARLCRCNVAFRFGHTYPRTAFGLRGAHAAAPRRPGPVSAGLSRVITTAAPPTNRSLLSHYLHTFILQRGSQKARCCVSFAACMVIIFMPSWVNFVLLFLRRVFFITDTRPEPRPSRQRSALSVIQHSTHVWTSRLTPYKRARPQLSNSARHTSAR